VALPRLDPAQARFAAGGILPWHQTAEAARFYHRGGDGCGDDRPMPGTLARRWLTGLLLFHDGRITARPVETRYQAILDGVASGSEHDWNRLGCCPGGLRGRFAPGGGDDGDLSSYQI